MVEGSVLVQMFVNELLIISHLLTQGPLINSQRSTQEVPMILQVA